MPTLLQNQAFIKAAAALSVEVYGFINDDSRISLVPVLAHFGAQAIDLWKILVPVCKGESNKGGMPLVLKVHFYELQANLLLKVMWSSGSPVFDYIRYARDGLNDPNLEELADDLDIEFEEYESNKSSGEEEPKDEVGPLLHQDAISFFRKVREPHT